jgi:hypothetical protein
VVNAMEPTTGASHRDEETRVKPSQLRTGRAPGDEPSIRLRQGAPSSGE